MSKYSAFNAQLDAGTAQVETAIIATDGAALTGSGNANVIVTLAGMPGSPITESVALSSGDTPATCARKIAAHFQFIGIVESRMTIVPDGVNVIFTLIEAVANDATFNIAYADDTCAGLTDDLTSENTTAGVVKVEIAGVKNIGGPGLSLDTEDVTTHDQTTSFEEIVATILRSGEISLDIVYDPADATHDASTGAIYRLEDRVFTCFDLIFVGAYNWAFYGYITGFEPGAPVEGALTATVKIKITKPPILE